MNISIMKLSAGGSGAGANFDGCDAVQTHMTNSRITDPEVLEWWFPVFGLHGGCVGAVGENKLIRYNGELIQLGSCAQMAVQQGDVLEIKTPAGGGYGLA